MLDQCGLGCLNTRPTTTGYVFKAYKGVVSRMSRRQYTVAASTTQAELLTSTAAGKEAVWLRQLLANLELWSADGKPVSLLNDKSGATQMARHQLGFKSHKASNMRAQWIRNPSIHPTPSPERNSLKSACSTRRPGKTVRLCNHSTYLLSDLV